MYNPQLEMFIRVAEAGSFSKAAEECFITPTAAIKQINSLEAGLGLRLFTRTHRGLTLTDSGKSLYADAKYIIGYCKESVARAKNASENKPNVIKIGTSPMAPGEFLLQLRERIQQHVGNLRFELVQFDNTPENAREILANLGKNIDVVAGLFDETYEAVRGSATLKLHDAPICCAVSIKHKLAEKATLTVDDIRDTSFMLIRRGWNTYTDKLRDFAIAQSMPIVDFDFYNLAVFNRCANEDYALMAFDFWKHSHPLIKILPVEWDFTVPYGLLYSPVPSEPVARFIAAVEKTTAQ
jgi:DNA-binding transcriptional LysR family regulator